MKKNIIIGIIILAIVLLFVCTYVIGVNSKKTTPANDNTAEIIMNITGGIPYNWEYTIGDTNIVKFKEKKQAENDNSKEMLIGGGNDEIYVFEGLKEGTTTIKFELKSVISDDIAETKDYDIIVDENLKVTVNEK